MSKSSKRAERDLKRRRQTWVPELHWGGNFDDSLANARLKGTLQFAGAFVLGIFLMLAGFVTLIMIGPFLIEEWKEGNWGGVFTLAVPLCGMLFIGLFGARTVFKVSVRLFIRKTPRP